MRVLIGKQAMMDIEDELSSRLKAANDYRPSSSIERLGVYNSQAYGNDECNLLYL